MSRKRRVVFCTHASIYSSLVLKTLLQSNHIEVVAIINSTRIRRVSDGWFKSALELVQFSGFRYAFHLFCLTDLFSLLQPFVRLKSVNHYAKKYAIPIYHTKDINDEKGIAYLRHLAPDILLCAYFNQRIKAPILTLPKLACLNLHPSLLPAYRGVDPVFYAMLRSETILGVTLHRLDENFDTGHILAQKTAALEADRSLFYHYGKLFIMAGEIAVDQLERLTPEETGKTQAANGFYDAWPCSQKVDLFFQKKNNLLTLRDYFYFLYRP